jgi:hypothetical protein
MAGGDTVKTETDKVLQSIKEALISPDPAKREDASRKLKFFMDTLNQIIADARLTAKSPFDLSMVSTHSTSCC